MKYEIAVATDIAPRTKCCFRWLKNLGGSGKQCRKNALYVVTTDAMPLFPWFADGQAAPLCLEHMSGLVGSFIFNSANEVEEPASKVFRNNCLRGHQNPEAVGGTPRHTGIGDQ